MKPSKSKRAKTPPSQKGRRLRRRLELLTSEAIMAMVVVVFGSFFLAGVARYFLGTAQTAAVVSALLVQLANGDRASEGLAQLRVNPGLTAAAQGKANDMAAKSYFAHVAPDGKDPWYWFKQAGYSFTYAGENLAVDFTDSVDVEKAWMNSPAHRENILDPHYTEIGIASAAGTYQGHPTIFVVQEFGTPTAVAAPQQVVVSNIPEAPTQVATAAAQKPTPVSAAKQKAPVSSEKVLGSSVNTVPPAPISIAPQILAIAPISGGNFSIAAATPVVYAVSAPRDVLRSVYIVLALFLVFALAYTTGFEMKKHHLRHVGAVSGLMLLMGLLFLTADYFIFMHPQVSSDGPAAAQAL